MLVQEKFQKCRSCKSRLDHSQGIREWDDGLSKLDTGKNINKPVAAAILGTGALSSAIVWQAVAGSAATISDPNLMLVFAPLSLSIVIYLLLYCACLKNLSRPAMQLPQATPIVPVMAVTSTAAPKPEERGTESSESENTEMSQAQIKALIENAADVICLINIDCTLLQVNPASIPVWGYRPEELIGHNLREFLLSDEDFNATLKALTGAEHSIDQLFFENRFRRKNGEIVDMLWSAHWSISDGGLFCVAHNITERKRAEKLIQASEERVRGILANLPAGVTLVNRSGCLEYMNQTAFDLTGYNSSTDLTEVRAASFLSFCREPFMMKQMDDLIAKNASRSIECFITGQSGERIPAEASVSKITLDGEASCLCIFLDNRVKHQVERTKREFVAMVSHDLRSPLTSLSMVLSYLSGGHCGTLTERGNMLTSKAQEECNRLMKLVNDLLDLEKMKAGKFSMHMIDTPIDDAIKASINAVEQLETSRGVHITMKSPGDLICNCDGARVIQVLVNLLDNAIKYSNTGSEVRVEAADNGDDVLITVANKGRAIPPEKLENIFDRFEQVDPSDATEQKGTGLGLAICKTMVEQHGGKIWIKSSDSKETVFAFTLPKGGRENASSDSEISEEAASQA